MNPRRWWEELVYATFIASGVPKHELDPKFDQLFDSLYMRFTSDLGYSKFHDSIDCLKELQRHNIYTGVISNSDERLTDVLKSLKLTPYLDFVLPSYRAGFEKPDKEIFDQALRLVGTPIKPEEALHVGDDINTDYRGTFYDRDTKPLSDSFKNNNPIYRGTTGWMERHITRTKYLIFISFV
ncbi:HAD-like domain-containing protein [Phascolomyces articulosus]|uniref:HAD-like domain-containing protein n=1 Tax=Phascolomyces articulosus TaxID=60185 RepID=A0AAD5JNP5_9FUNG|nr:HAD-like domain-containing protein [Phascolomyces articulosus]